MRVIFALPVCVTENPVSNNQDFGLSKEGIDKDEDRTGTFCGTPEYLGNATFPRNFHSHSKNST